MLETSFRIHRDEVTRTLIGCPPTVEQKIGFDAIATERQLRHAEMATKQRNFSRKQRNSYSTYVILTTAMAERQRNGENQA